MVEAEVSAQMRKSTNKKPGHLYDNGHHCSYRILMSWRCSKVYSSFLLLNKMSHQQFCTLIYASFLENLLLSNQKLSAFACMTRIRNMDGQFVLYLPVYWPVVHSGYLPHYRSGWVQSGLFHHLYMGNFQAHCTEYQMSQHIVMGLASNVGCILTFHPTKKPANFSCKLGM